MNKLYRYKWIVLVLIAPVFLGLTGCMHHAVVSSHPVAHSKILISSNSAYYYRYGYPPGYNHSHRQSHHKPKVVVVKHINPQPIKPFYRQPIHSAKIYNKPIHQPHKTHVIKKVIKVDQRNHRNFKTRDLPKPHHNVPRVIERNKVVVKEYPRFKDDRYVKYEPVSERRVNRSFERNTQENDRSRYQERPAKRELNHRTSHQDRRPNVKERQPR